MKKLISLVCICFFTINTLHAQIFGNKNQENTENDIKIPNLFQKQRNKYLEKLRKQRAEMDSTNFTCAIAVTDNTGFYEEDQKNKKAINSLMQDILMDGKVDFDTKNRDANAPLTPVDPYEKAISFMEWGENLMSMNNYKAAENNFLKAETNFLESGKTKNIYYAKLLTDLGLPYSALGNSEKANQSYYWGAFILTEN